MWPESGEIQRTLFSDPMLLAKELFSDEFRLAKIRKKKKKKLCQISPESGEISSKSLLRVSRNHY
jgi:hypothetical protein